MNTATNRNIAAKMLDTDIISYIDADDQMHFQRLEIIEKAFVENDIDLFLHNYVDMELDTLKKILMVFIMVFIMGMHPLLKMF